MTRRWLGSIFGNTIDISGVNGYARNLKGVFSASQQYHIARKGGWIDIFEATGGSIIPAAVTGNSYQYHVFKDTGPATFEIYKSPASGINFQFLLVGGGGAGGWDVGGGGGGGGVVTTTSNWAGPTDPTYSFDVVVGAGGVHPGSSDPNSAVANQGQSSSITINGTTITALYGGGGGNYSGGDGSPGGSGGGASGYSSPGTYGNGIQPSQPTHGGLVNNYGNPGGTTTVSNTSYSGTGGGGAGGVGGNATTGPTPGGSGQPFPNYAGPILASVLPSAAVSNIGPTGLYGAGGAATDDGGPVASPKPDNTGAGGQGPGSPNTGASGSPGIVIVRFIPPS